MTGQAREEEECMLLNVNTSDQQTLITLLSLQQEDHPGRLREAQQGC